MTIGTTVMARPWFDTHRPAEQRSDEEVAVASLVAPDERAMEEQRDEQQVEPVHLGEGRLLPERAGEGQAQRRRGGDDRAHVEADHDQHGDPDRERPPRPPENTLARQANGPDRDRRERLHQERVERVAGRVHDPEPCRDHLRLGPVADAHAGQDGPDVDGDGHEGRDDGGHGGRHRWLAESVEHRDGWYGRCRLWMRSGSRRVARYDAASPLAPRSGDRDFGTDVEHP